MTTHTVIYHSADLDGFCSGAIAKLHLLKSGVPEDDIEMLGWNYGQEIPEITDGQMVIMTDISFPPEAMVDLRTRCMFTWIDHHKTAMADAEAHGYSDLPGVREIGNSASLLAWMFFFIAPIPDVVYWVDRYDVWKKEDPQFPGRDWQSVMDMQYGMRFHLSNPCQKKFFDAWNVLIEDNLLMQHVFQDGQLIHEAEKKSNEIRCSKAFDLTFEDHKFAAVNNTLAGSAVLESYARSDHDGLMVFSYHGKSGMWDVSMYQNEKSTQDVDLSVIAKKYGGGGHKGSCGFRVKEISTILNHG